MNMIHAVMGCGGGQSFFTGLKFIFLRAVQGCLPLMLTNVKTLQRPETPLNDDDDDDDDGSIKGLHTRYKGHLGFRLTYALDRAAWPSCTAGVEMLMLVVAAIYQHYKQEHMQCSSGVRGTRLTRLGANGSFFFLSFFLSPVSSAAAGVPDAGPGGCSLPAVAGGRTTDSDGGASMTPCCSSCGGGWAAVA